MSPQQPPPISGPQLKAITESIMKNIKLQSDRKRELVSRKSVLINPQVLQTTNPNVYGPYVFGTKFAKNPFMTFGTASVDRSKGLLVVYPYVDSWVSDSGGVTGFNLGVFALTPVPVGLIKYTISYHASGKATGYKSDNNSRWQGHYDSNTSRHLQADDGDLEKPG